MKLALALFTSLAAFAAELDITCNVQPLFTLKSVVLGKMAKQVAVASIVLRSDQPIIVPVGAIQDLLGAAGVSSVDPALSDLSVRAAQQRSRLGISKEALRRIGPLAGSGAFAAYIKDGSPYLTGGLAALGFFTQFLPETTQELNLPASAWLYSQREWAVDQRGMSKLLLIRYDPQNQKPVRVRASEFVSPETPSVKIFSELGGSR